MNPMDSLPVQDTIVFIGPGWNCFEQLCGALRKTGLQTLWIGYPHNLLNHLRTRLITPTVSAATAPEVCQRLSELGLSRVLDIVLPEHLADELMPLLAALDLPESVRANLTERHEWLAKDGAMRRLREAGIHVPAQICVVKGELDIDAAVQTLGLPVVVKGTVGGGGSAVHICRDKAAVAAAVQAITDDRGEVFLEEFCSGEDGLCYAAAHADGQVLAEASYAGVRDEGANASPVELGPFDALRTIDDPELCRLGRAVMGCLRGSGVTNIDVIRREDGRLTVIDVNMRPFGPMVTLNLAGVDLTSGYLAALRGETSQSNGQEWPDILLPAFPRTAINTGLNRPLRGLRSYLKHARPYWGWSGPGYLAAETIRTTRSVLGHQARRLKTPKSR